VNEFLDTLYAGGPVMVPLGILSLVAVAIVLERLWALRRTNYLKTSTVTTLTRLVAERRFTRAVEFCHQNPGPFSELVAAMVENRNAPYDELREILEDKGRHQLTGLQRGLPALATIVAGAPLLGLLGTVIGMIKIFAVVADAGSQVTEQLSQGIAQALITTATGLIIAIPILFVHSYLEGKAVSILADVEAHILDLLHVVRRPRSAREASTDEEDR
jgi:biopolymer transport protein ExbB